MLIAEKLDRYLLEGREKDRGERLKMKAGRYSPSLLGACYRRQEWERLGEPQSDPADAETLRIFEAGDLFHGLIQKLFPEAQVEVEVVIGDLVYGHADLVLEDEVVDIKSCGAWQFKKFGKMTVEEFAEEKPDYMMQVGCYALGLGKAGGRIALVNKETVEILEFAFPLKMFKEKVERELEVLRGIRRSGELPRPQPRLYRQKDGSYKECEYCSWKTKCEIMEGKKVF